MSGLGETFRNARESQGLSLSDVSDRLHIRAVYLAAIEAEDWPAIGPAVYIRGFLRSYARFLGLDADAAVAGYGGAGTPAAVVLRPDAARAGFIRTEATRSRPSFWAYLGVVVAAGLVVFAGYEYFEYQRGEGRSAVSRASPVAVAKPSDAAPGSSASAGPDAAVPENRFAPKNANRSSAFSVRLKDSSWLHVVVDGKTAMEGVYPAGTSRSFSGRAATVRVGNAGGVDITVDGKDLGPMGGLGDVAERSFQL